MSAITFVSSYRWEHLERLRGNASWANSHSAGRCGRIGTEVLKRKQYRGPARLSSVECRSLALLAGVSRVLPSRRVMVAGSRGSPVVTYSDADREPGAPVPTLGWVVFERGAIPQGRAAKYLQPLSPALLPEASSFSLAKSLPLTPPERTR